MGVPRHLQVPLSIDTSISYSLDKSMFPGLDDPLYKYEPVLLIATEPAIPSARINMHRPFGEMGPVLGNPTCASVDLPNTVSSTDDLLGIMDLHTDDLFSGLKNTQDYLSLVEDVIQELPHGDELQYLECPQRDLTEIVNCNKQPKGSFNDRLCVNKSASRTSSATNGYLVAHNPLQRSSNFTGRVSGKDYSVLFLNNSDSVNQFQAHEDYVSKGLSSQVSSVNNPVFRKRKRCDDYQESSYQKKPCYSNEFVNYISYHQSSWNNRGYGFTGTRHGNQIMVM